MSLSTQYKIGLKNFFWSSFGFLHQVVAECSDISEDCTYTIFRVTESCSSRCWNKEVCTKYGSGRRGNGLYQANGSPALQERHIPGPTVAPQGLFLEF